MSGGKLNERLQQLVLGRRPRAATFSTRPAPPHPGRDAFEWRTLAALLASSPLLPRSRPRTARSFRARCNPKSSPVRSSPTPQQKQQHLDALSPPPQRRSLRRQQLYGCGASPAAQPGDGDRTFRLEPAPAPAEQGFSGVYVIV